MTAPGQPGRVTADPIVTITDLITSVEPDLGTDRIRAVVTGVVGGRAKARRLASHLAEHPGVLADGRSPAPRAVGDLLIALRQAGAVVISAPRCAECGKLMRTLQRRGQDWYCGVCGPQPEDCAACGNHRRVATRDRAGRPRCAQCPDADDRDPIEIIRAVVAGVDPHADHDVIADAVRRSAPRLSYQQKLAWALEANPGLLTGDGHLAPQRAVLRLIDLLHDAGTAGIVRPACPRCHRAVRIDKPLDGQRVCRTCIAHSRIQQCSRCGAHREPATRDEQGRPLCPNCLITDPANLEYCISCGRRRPVNTRTPQGPLCPSCPGAAVVHLQPLWPGQAMRHLPHHRPTVVPLLPTAIGLLLGLRQTLTHHLRHPHPAALRGLHPHRDLAQLPNLHRPRLPTLGPVRPMPDQPATQRPARPALRRLAPRPAGPAAQHRHHRTPDHRPALAE